MVALRYVVTGIVAPSSLGQPSMQPSGTSRRKRPRPAISEDLLRAQARKLKRFLWRAGVEVSFVYDQADFGLATLYSGATTRSAQPSASLVVRF